MKDSMFYWELKDVMATEKNINFVWQHKLIIFELSIAKAAHKSTIAAEVEPLRWAADKVCIAMKKIPYDVMEK